MKDSKEENDPDKTFDSATEMPYWLKLDPTDFIHSIAHEIREEAFRAKVFMKAIEDDPDIVSHEIKSIWGPKTVGENSIEIGRHLNRIWQLTMIAAEYADAQQSQNTDSEA